MTGHDEQQTATQTETSDLIESVRELISMMSKGGISELDLTTGDVSIRLRTPSSAMVTESVVVHGSAPSAPVHAVPQVEEPQGHIITSPMIGTFYSAPSPGEAPFVKIGDEIEVGQVIGIIEAMKIMNEITADYSGVILEALVQNAQPVEYGSPLLRVAPADSLE